LGEIIDDKYHGVSAPELTSKTIHTQRGVRDDEKHGPKKGKESPLFARIREPLQGLPSHDQDNQHVPQDWNL